MKKIPVYFIMPNLSISGVLTFCENAINYINASDSGYEAAILYTGTDENAGTCSVPIVKLSEGYHSIEHNIVSLIKFLNSHEKAVIIPNYMFSMLPAMAFLHKGIMRFFILHSDEQVYYDSARLMCSYFDTIVCVSGYIEGKLVAADPYLKAKSSVIPYGIDIPDSMPEKSGQNPINIIYTGRLLEYQKRVSRLAEIVLKLDEKTRDYRFVFVGDGSSAPMLKQSLAQQVDRGNVLFTGRVGREEINSYLSEAEIFVLTSDFEGTPLSLLEAMAYGCVPVVNRIESGIPEVIDNGMNGFIIDDCVIDDFVGRIIELKDDRKRLSSMADRAYQKAVSDYSTQVMSRRFLALFDRFFDSCPAESKPAEFSTEPFSFIVPWLYEPKMVSLLKFFDRVAIFGCGAAGKATLDFMNELFPGKCVMMIDDNFKDKFWGLDVVTTEAFLNNHEEEVDMVVFGGHQKINPALTEKTKKPFMKLDNIV
ncbi:MAG: glycosyltransferase family 4 protein [Deferribacterales bacterium]